MSLGANRGAIRSTKIVGEFSEFWRDGRTRLLRPLAMPREVAADEQVERAGGDIVVTVLDDGPGIPPDLAERAFDPGVRGNSADAHHGAGLGLPLARRLARAADGDVTLGSSERGAELVVRIPAG